MVTTAGKPSGTTATATETAVKNISSIDSPDATPMSSTRAATDHTRNRQHSADAVKLFLQRRLRIFDALDEGSDFPQFGVHAGGGDNGRSPAIGDVGAHVEHVETVAEGRYRVC